MSNINQHHYVALNNIQVSGKRRVIITVGAVAAISIAAIFWVAMNRTAMSKSVDFTKTAEYNSILSEHVDLSQVSKAEVDQTAALDNLSERFGVYRFTHSKLQGKWGSLHVLIDRQASKTVSRSLLQVNGKPPQITVKNGCLQVPQVKDQLIEKYEICIN